MCKIVSGFASWICFSDFCVGVLLFMFMWCSKMNRANRMVLCLAAITFSSYIVRSVVLAYGYRIWGGALRLVDVAFSSKFHWDVESSHMNREHFVLYIVLFRLARWWSMVFCKSVCLMRANTIHFYCQSGIYFLYLCILCYYPKYSD